MQEEFLKIPMKRIAVLIGHNGETKKRIECLTHTKINVDSKTGEVDVSFEGENAINLYNALNIIKAIARGFSPEHALLLLDENYYIEFIDLTHELGKNEKLLLSKRGRVIGKHGSVRQQIEQDTGTFISVYGKTIGIIGKIEGVQTAKKAIEMLLSGATHDSVKGFLRKKAIQDEKFEL
jgi:ribosomal RNA assembly protein